MSKLTVVSKFFLIVIIFLSFFSSCRETKISYRKEFAIVRSCLLVTIWLHRP